MCIRFIALLACQVTCSLLLMAVTGCNKSNQTDSTASLDCLPANMQNGVIAFYSFSNGSINDYSGNNYHLTNSSTASPGTDRAGNPNCAFTFDRSKREFLHYTNPSFVDNFQTLPFSISLWYRNTTTTGPEYEVLVGRDTMPHCPDTRGQWSVGLYDLRKPVFGINESCLWWQVTTVADTLVWKHYVVTCQGKDLKLYINALLTSDAPLTGCTVNTPTLNAGDLVMGKYYSGYLDDVVIYNRILTPAEIIKLYNTQACCQ